MYGIEHKVLALLISCGFLLHAYVIRVWIGTYLAPAGIFSIAWFCFTFFPLAFLFDAPINPMAILFILLCSISFSLGAVPFNWKFAINKNGIEKSKFNPNFGNVFISRTLKITSLLAVVFSLITMVNNGLGIEEILFDFIVTSGKYAVVRALDGMEYGIVGTLSIFFTYLAPVLGGFVLSVQRSTFKKVWIFIVAMVPSIFTMITQSSKLVFLLSLCFLLAALMTTKIYNNRLMLFDKLPYLKILVGAVFLVPLVLLSFTTRQSGLELSDLGDVLESLKYPLSSYIFGQVYAFSDFFSFYVGMPAMSVFKNDFGSFGAYTYASIFDMLNIGINFPPGMYLESGYFFGVFETNIFTAFRGLIYDFGGLGSLIALMVSGFIAHLFFYKMLVVQRPWFASMVYITTIVAILMMYLFSVFVARYMFLNAFAVYLILKLNAMLEPRRRLKAIRRKMRLAKRRSVLLAV